MLTVVISGYWDYSDQGQCVYSKFVYNNCYLCNKNILFLNYLSSIPITQSKSNEDLLQTGKCQILNHSACDSKIKISNGYSTKKRVV